MLRAVPTTGSVRIVHSIQIPGRISNTSDSNEDESRLNTNNIMAAYITEAAKSRPVA